MSGNMHFESVLDVQRGQGQGLRDGQMEGERNL